MDFEKFTEKSLGVLKSAEEIAIEHMNQSVEEVHVFLALLSDSDGLFFELLSSMNKDVVGLKGRAEELVGTLPSVSGSGASRLYV